MLGNCGLFAGRTGSAEPEIGMTPRYTRADSRGPLVYLARP
jgi:hypothetical protein